MYWCDKFPKNGIYHIHSDVKRKNNPENLREKCGITPDGIKCQLNQMQQQNLIRRVEPGKGGYWVIV